MAAQAKARQPAATPRARGRSAKLERGPIVPAAARALAVFEIFAREKRELAKSEVARLLDVPESSASDLLDTLHQIGYLSRTPTTRKYYPTTRLLTTAQDIGLDSGLAAFGSEAAKLMSEQTGETSVCAVLDGDKIKVIAVSDGKHRLRYVLNVGDTFTVHATAIGKALLGGLDDDTMRRVLRLKPLARRTPATKTDPNDVEAEVKRFRTRGVYSSVDEGAIGVTSVAISDTVGGEVVGVGLIGPSERVREDLPRLIKAVGGLRETIFV